MVGGARRRRHNQTAAPADETTAVERVVVAQQHSLVWPGVRTLLTRSVRRLVYGSAQLRNVERAHIQFDQCQQRRRSVGRAPCSRRRLTAVCLAGSLAARLPASPLLTFFTSSSLPDYFIKTCQPVDGACLCVSLLDEAQTVRCRRSRGRGPAAVSQLSQGVCR